MAKVPSLFQDLMECYSENEEHSSNNEDFSLNQKSFYDASYSPHHEVHMETPLSLNTSETLETTQLTCKEYASVVTGKEGKILKRTRLSLNQPITDEDLKAIVNDQEEVRFDIAVYKPTNNFESIPVTLRVSKSRLFVSAENRDEPVLLKELPETPKVITNKTNLIFLWENYGTMYYFRSLAYPDLYLATKEDDWVHLAQGEPSIIDFRIWED
ncbi:PREDICTED: interleukin-1 alpha-like [Elephantulus edwardii]|uniref:interleukin-1 alpha-like n=1 Tax=Elephantulus edwardii TaxID=28737 RepID=UPI0003F08536|nr:PREDICTED: interleukin-1 alpha-like [Elephantulus edwardii]